MQGAALERQVRRVDRSAKATDVDSFGGQDVGAITAVPTGAALANAVEDAV